MYLIRMDSLGLSSKCIEYIFIFSSLFALIEIGIILKTKRDYKRRIVSIFFFPYILTVLSLTLLDRIPFPNYRYNLTILWSYENFNYAFWPNGRQVVCNIIMLLPFGFMLPFMLEDTKYKKIGYYTPILAIIFSSLIEITQLITKRGFFEFDDIFHNSMGALLGYYIYLFYRSLKEF